MNQSETEEVQILATVPIACYKKPKEAYRWPAKNKCPMCEVGRFTRVKDTGILKCKICEFEMHVPFMA